MIVIQVVVYILIGFVFSLIYLKRSLYRSGAGNCKMCRNCDYLKEWQQNQEDGTAN